MDRSPRKVKQSSLHPHMAHTRTSPFMADFHDAVKESAGKDNKKKRKKDKSGGGGVGGAVTVMVTARIRRTRKLEKQTEKEKDNNKGH